MAKNNTPTNSGKKRRRSLKSIHQLTALKATKGNAAQVQAIKQSLLLWAGFMLDISPSFAGALYGALSEEWIMRVRGVIYDSYATGDPRDRTFITLNSIVLDALREAQGEARGYPVSQEELDRESASRAAMLQSGADLFQRLAQSASENLSREVRPLPLIPLTSEGEYLRSDLAEGIADLQAKLRALERLPENEGERFKLEAKIHQLEREAISDEWPDVIGGSDV